MRMRNIALYAGTLLLIAGALITAGVLRYSEKTELLKIGDTRISVTEEREPDRRLGYVLMGLGVLGLGLGTIGRR